MQRGTMDEELGNGDYRVAGRAPSFSSSGDSSVPNTPNAKASQHDKVPLLRGAPPPEGAGPSKRCSLCVDGRGQQQANGISKHYWGEGGFSIARGYLPKHSKIKLGVLSFLVFALLAGLIVVSLGAFRSRQQQSSQQQQQAGLDAELAAALSGAFPAGWTVTVPPTHGGPIRKAPKPNNATTPLGGMLPVLDPRIDYSSLLRPAYHIAPEKGWLNDPNGMFQAPDTGLYHVFYQYNPAAPVWGSPWWAHVVSQDLAHWTQLPPALLPDAWYDRDGVFSGSATIQPDGTPIMLYTGVMNFSQYGFYYQQQAAAVPANLSDPYLTNWTKLDTNPLPMHIPPGGTHAQFRDPMTAWRVSRSEVAGLIAQMEQHQREQQQQQQQRVAGGGQNQTAGRGGPGALGSKTLVVNGTGSTQQLPPARTSSSNGSSDGNNTSGDIWMTAVGALDDCLGAAVLYMSQGDLVSWEYAGTLFSQLSQDYERYAACMPPPDERDKPPEDEGGTVPPGSKGFGGHCDQFGRDCRMWECPDFGIFSSSDVLMFKYSDQERGRYPFARDFYVLGNTSQINYSNALVQDMRDAFVDDLGGRVYPPQPLDYGSVYASKSFTDLSGRRLWYGWVYEESAGCTELCADGTPFILRWLGWQGAQTLPRLITYDPGAQALLFNPAPELSALRQGPLAGDTFTLPKGDGSTAQARVILREVPPAYTTCNATSNGSMTAAEAQVVERLEEERLDSVFSKSPSGRRQVEIQLVFALEAGGGGGGQDNRGSGPWPFELAVTLLTGGGTYTRMYLNGTAQAGDLASPPAGAGGVGKKPTSLSAFNMGVWVDRSASGGMSSTNMQGGTVPLPPGGVDARNLTLQVFVDRSLLEVYALGGRAVVTSRFYPTPTAVGCRALSGSSSSSRGLRELGAWGVQVEALWSRGPVGVDVAVHELGSAWVGGP